MKKTILSLTLFFVACVQMPPEKKGVCITRRTTATKTQCAGAALRSAQTIVYCQNDKTDAECLDVESCFAENFILFNRTMYADNTCAQAAFTYGCGDGIFSAGKENCP
jgi:hypothetical protein